MAKELPYFKFEPGQWDTGNIQLCSFEAQGAFISICSIYWQRLGDLKHRFALMKVCKGDERLLKELIDSEVIKQSGENLTVNFLDQQLYEFKIISNKRSEAGKKGGDNRNLSPEISRVKGNQIYVIHCFDGNEEFIKVGVTSESISRRFSGKIPYEYDVLFQFCTNDNLDLESFCSDSLYSKYAYKPKEDFTGYLECYNMSVFDELSSIIKHRTGSAIAMPKQRNAIRGEERREKERKEVIVVTSVPTVQDKSSDFYKLLVPFVEKYGKDTVREFYEYWTEKSKTGKRLRFEDEKFFDVSRRLATWSGRKFKKINIQQKGGFVQ